MKKYTLLFGCCLAMIFTAANVQAQQGFTGPQGFAGQGFTGPFQTITVAQVHSFPNKAPAVLTGNIVASLGSDRYLFRDASGEVVIKIKSNRWWGLSVGPDDRIEIGGELKRDKRSGQIRYFDAKQIRRAL